MEKEKLEQRVEKLEEKINRLEGEDEYRDEEKQLSRRQFLKKVGMGALGIGAMAVPAASKVKITDSGITKDGNSYWYSGLGQNYDLNGNSLVDSGTTIYNASTSSIPSTRTHKTLPIVVPAVNLQAGETIQVSRFNLPTGKQIKIWKAVVSQTDGTSDANLEIEVYNHTDAVSVYSTTNNTLQEGTPLASGATGDEIEIRINNNDGSAEFNAHATLIATIE